MIGLIWQQERAVDKEDLSRVGEGPLRSRGLRTLRVPLSLLTEHPDS